MSILLFAVLCALYMGWSMGANDAANCVGADIGSGVMPMRDGIIITCLFSFLGAIFLGSRVIKTIGKGIAPLNTLPCEQAMLIALTALLGAGAWVTIATFKKYPVSTSHAIVGAVAGSGLALHTVIKWEKMLHIVICWVFTPLGAAVLGVIVYPLVRRFFALKWVKKYEKPLVLTGIYLTSTYLAFTWGANDVANATGVLVGLGNFTPVHASLIGGLAIILGVVTWGYKVIETVGFKITNLTPLMTIGVEIACALNVHLYTLWGIPVSTSHSIVGAIWGVGLVHGIKTINLKLAGEIVMTWALTPVVAGLISYILLKLITMVC